MSTATIHNENARAINRLRAEDEYERTLRIQRAVSDAFFERLAAQQRATATPRQRAANAGR